jgi:hypothetical protein
MRIERRKTMLNRALFVNRPLDSGALTVLATLIHRFTEPGDYELFVRREGRLIARSPVQVIGQLPDASGGPAGDVRTKAAGSGASYQVNIDLATIGQSTGDCEPEPTYVVATGGVMGFYVSAGTGRYTVALTRILADKKMTVLDSAAGLPEGDFFAVTLVRPGVYSVTNRLADAQARVDVNLPKPEGYRPSDASLVQAVRGGFEPAEMKLFSGQSLVFQCQTAAHLVVELIEPSPSISERGETSDGERPRYTVRKRRKPQNP